jgi:hypothetical protein
MIFYYACTNVRNSRQNVHQPAIKPDGLCVADLTQ